MKKVTLYSLENCPYCEKAKSLLRARGIDYQEIKVDRGNASEVQALVQKSGMRTFPQIFSGEQLIGGYSELDELDRNGGIESLAADTQAPKKSSGCGCH